MKETLKFKYTDEVKAMLKDFNYFCSNFMFIRDKDGNIVPLVLNKAQKIVYEKYLELKQSNKPVRILVLKARQKGISTLWQAIGFWEQCQTPNFNMRTIGHILEASDNLLNMAKTYFKYMPEGITYEGERHRVKPYQKASNKKELVFSVLDSFNRVLTAGNDEDTGRSGTTSFLHCTEVAFWQNQKATLLALLQTVPRRANTTVVLESTANGIGDEFYNRWKAAKEGRSEYIPIFISWLIDDEYTIPFETPQEREHFGNNLTPSEKLLVKKGATYEHLKWRRFIIVDQCDGDEKLFMQEYPSDDREAFLTTGRPFFNSATVDLRYSEAMKEPLMQGELTWIMDKGQRIGVSFNEQPQGYIKIYSKLDDISVNDRFRFPAGSDTAEGLAQGDYSVIKVLDRKTMEVCLTWHGHIDTDLFAEEMLKIQTYLGSANFYVCIEKNSSGLAVIKKAFELGVNLYYSVKYDQGYALATDKVGFHTNMSTRKLVLDRVKEFVRENIFTDRELEAWDEAMTFVYNDQGKPTAQNKDKDPETKCYDDRVLTWAFMLECHMWLPSYQVKETDERPARSYIKRYKRMKGKITKF